MELWYGPPPRSRHERQAVVLDGAEQTLVLPAGARPTLVMIDPERRFLITTLDWQRPASEAIDQAGSHPRVAARLDAVNELARASADAAVVGDHCDASKPAPAMPTPRCAEAVCERALADTADPGGHRCALVNATADRERDLQGAAERVADALGWA